MPGDMCEAEVHFSPDYPPLRQLVRDLTAEGLSLPGAMIIPCGVTVEVRLRLPGRRRVVSVRGLAQARPDAGGCEVRFSQLSAAARVAIHRFIEELDAADPRQPPRSGP